MNAIPHPTANLSEHEPGSSEPPFIEGPGCSVERRTAERRSVERPGSEGAVRTARALGALAFGVALLGLLGWAAPAASAPSAAESAEIEAVEMEAAELEAATGLEGRVKGEQRPLDSVRVYLYHLADFQLDKSITDPSGRFLFERLPAGLYKVIAYKAGFVPAVLQLKRTAADSYQYLDVELMEAEESSARETFWSVRSKIPADVLREMTLDELGNRRRSYTELAAGNHGHQLSLPQGLQLRGEMQALTGIDQIAAESGQMVGGQVGIEGQVGNVQIGLAGNYRQLQTQDLAPGEGQASLLSFNLASGDDTRVTVTSLSNRMDGGFRPSAESVDFEHYQVSVSQNLGNHSRTQVSAQYTDETNFHRQGLHDPLGIPEASRIFRLAGSYARELGDTTLETGVRFWQRDYDPVGAALGDLDPIAPSVLSGDERVDFYGQGNTRIQPAVVVEYGLYTRMTDGSLSLAPRGGVVVDLGGDWQATTTVSRRMETGGPVYNFLPTLQQRNDDCAESEEHCYRLLFTRTRDENEGQISFGAIHREYAETLRLYFSDDFFNRMESLYLVPGDRLPELQVSWTRKLAPKILARLESNLAAGGGGIFYATDREAYENQVRYLVTSLDTRFQSTSTGLFIAFHHLQQQLNPLASPLNADALDTLEQERLQLMLTQDLNVLLNLTQSWAVHLNMELSRGNEFFEDPTENEELRKRILGGIAVRF